MLTQNDIQAFLREYGIRPDDKVTVHAALRSVGKIENGADGLIDGLCTYLHDGLLIIPTHTWDTVVRAHPYYDVRETVPCIGTLAKVAAFRKTASARCIRRIPSRCLEEAPLIMSKARNAVLLRHRSAAVSADCMKYMARCC